MSNRRSCYDFRHGMLLPSPRPRRSHPQQQDGLAESETTSIAGERRRPMVKESFGTWFREAGVKACRERFRSYFRCDEAERDCFIEEVGLT